MDAEADSTAMYLPRSPYQLLTPTEPIYLKLIFPTETLPRFLLRLAFYAGNRFLRIFQTAV